MSESAPTFDEWKRLYQAAIAFKDLAPWLWMQETDVFGIQNPETKEFGFVSIMGLLGEHLALALYLGAKGLQAFWELEEGTAEPSLELSTLPNHLQASFEDRDELIKRDINVIKKLGLKFRGHQVWPLFRSYRPGFLPWDLEAQEARFLTHALEQAVDVALRFKQDPELLTPGDGVTYLVRVPRKEKGDLVWEDQIVTVPPVEPDPILITVSVAGLEAVKLLPRDHRVVEMDLFVVPIRIQERGDRPYMPYTLLSVDRASGLVLASEFFEAEETPQQTWSLVPASVLQQIETMKAVPSRLLVGSPLLLHLVQTLADDLGLPVELTNHLPNLAQAREALLQYAHRDGDK